MLKKETLRTFWGILFVGWSIAIIILSLIPDEELARMGVDNERFRWDYIQHFAVFMLLAMIYLIWRKDDAGVKRISIMLIVCISLASISEFSQLLIPSRNFNYIDLLCNLAGLPFGILAVRLLYTFRPAAS